MSYGVRSFAGGGGRGKKGQGDFRSTQRLRSGSRLLRILSVKGSWFLSSDSKIFWASVSTLTPSQNFPLLATTVNTDATYSMGFFFFFFNVNMSLSKLWEMVKDREARYAAVHGVAKSQM